MYLFYVICFSINGVTIIQLNNVRNFWNKKKSKNLICSIFNLIFTRAATND